ncbi:PepSY-associated TM helix domain-containing protein [Aestuariispira insulae]|uniref:Putative iron-regulated membrane protein n=1 Tax=Aestuariispira insulae TaxID=1461337 RepID=A0A3D9HGK8_9PROT|nr:PepSY domain-containing protein [Aestuariispira insulae]RED48617.1 putative iron-regulated membrane protein [Aestuariispira insulae]
MTLQSPAPLGAAGTSVRTEGLAGKFYAAVWRWHFYAGLYVIPFLLMLAVTGLIMVYYNAIETRFGETIHVPIGDQARSPNEMAGAVLEQFPNGILKQFIPPAGPDRAALFQVATENGALIVSVDPYQNHVLASVNKEESWYNFASDIHGTLLIGDLGDRLIEIAASLSILMIITGLYLWWPRGSQSRGLFWPNLALRGRALWRDLHAVSGFYLSILMMFFLLSGLSWAGIWGGQFVQPWSSFPAEKWDDVPLSDQTHESLNHGGAVKEVPWGLEQTPLPASGSDKGIEGLPEGVPVSLSSIDWLARATGFGNTFRINIPADASGVFTITSDAWDGESESPTGDRTMHVDQYSGRILAQVGYDDYSPMAKAMAVSTAFHQGDMGWWNALLNALFCLMMIFLCISGLVLWWLRRPKGVARLAAPPMPSNIPLWKGAVFIMLLISLAFPMAGLTLLTVLAFDLLILGWVKPMKSILQ